MPIDQSNCITLSCNFYVKKTGLQEKIAQCNDVLMLHKKILKSVKRDSAILETFGAKYDQDTEPGVSCDLYVCTINKLVHHTAVDEDVERNRGVYSKTDECS